MSENWDEINAPEDVMDALSGVSEQNIYACTGEYDKLVVHTFKVDKSTGVLFSKEINLFLKWRAN